MQRIPAWPTGIASHIIPSSCGTLDRQRVANEAPRPGGWRGAARERCLTTRTNRAPRGESNAREPQLSRRGIGRQASQMGRRQLVARCGPTPPCRFARVLARRRDALDHSARFTDLVNQKSHQHDRRWASSLHCLRQTAKR
jgi:hypothetical protein